MTRITETLHGQVNLTDNLTGNSSDSESEALLWPGPLFVAVRKLTARRINSERQKNGENGANEKLFIMKYQPGSICWTETKSCILVRFASVFSMTGHRSLFLCVRLINLVSNIRLSCPKKSSEKSCIVCLFGSNAVAGIQWNSAATGYHFRCEAEMMSVVHYQSINRKFSHQSICIASHEMLGRINNQVQSMVMAYLERAQESYPHILHLFQAEKP